MKKIVSFALVIGLIITCFAGCNKREKRILYNVDLEKYVTLGDYIGLEVDKKADSFETTKNNTIMSDVQQYGLYVTKKSGKVKKNETANIDYEGKINGVAFEGGTAQGQDLLIGSGTFIPGFEDGLIGKKIGSTVKLNVTFPKDYGKEDLNGKDAVFTVKINYVTTNVAKEPENYYASLGYQSVEKYYEDIENRALGETLQNAILEKCKTKEYPQADLDFIYGKYYENFEDTLKANYNITVDQYISASGTTADKLKEELITNQVKPLMDMQMVWYAIFDKEGMKLTEEDKDQTIKEIIKSSGDTSLKAADIIEQYGEYYVEMVTVSNKVFDFVKSKAKIKG